MQNFKPYYAVIFTSKLTKNNKGYTEMAQKMEDLARLQSGFLSIDSAREDVGITVSYWKNLEAIKIWKQHSEHLIAQQKGRNQWYSWYNTRICKVEREYEFDLS
jgi:heme-degrading monooxygenase HmoA